MFIPELRVSKLRPYFNARRICGYLSPEKAKNKTRPFAEKTLLMYPELAGAAGIPDEAERNAVITAAVEKRLADASDEIDRRIVYFRERFDSFIPGFIEAQCGLFNYRWKETHPRIDCYVGYLPFYPRSAEDKWFYVSYNDEERVFSGAVHEINHMIFWEKWKEMKGLSGEREPGFPSPLWFLEEMIVDPTLNDPAVRPHTLYENRAYEQFYLRPDGGEGAMDRLRALYADRRSIEDFLLRAYELAESDIEALASAGG